ncbi:putative reverse transcriptase domain-containing protein, partial [Tanacetum coccineum]
IYTRSREAAVEMSWEDFKTLTREEFCPVNEIQKLETKFWNHAMVGAGHAAYTDRFHELARPVPHLVTPENKRIKSCNRLGHLAKDCRVVPRMVNPVNDRNSTAARGACFKCGGTNHFKAACPRLWEQRQLGMSRAFMLGAEEARQDPNIVTGIESSNLRFSYEIEMASRHLVEIDKVIRGYELEIEGHTFNIDLILFGSWSFDVIIRMDWLSKHNAEIICHEKVVRIPLRIGKTLRVIGERPEEKMRYLRSAKTKEQKKEDIIVVRNFPEVFSDDLSELPPN